MEPNSVDACAFTVLKSSFAARSSISIGFVAFGWPLRSPYSTTLEATCPMRAQRQNGGFFGEKEVPFSAKAGLFRKVWYSPLALVWGEFFPDVPVLLFTLFPPFITLLL